MRHKLTFGYTILAILTFSLFLCPSQAVSQALRGVVLSAEDRSAINSAEIRMTDMETGVFLTRLTGSDGVFVVDRLPGRVNWLEVSALGYLTHVDTVFAESEGDSLVVEIRLGVDAIPVDPLVVVASRRPVWESTEPRYLWEFFERQEIYSRIGLGSRFYDREALDSQIGKIGSLSRLESLWPISSFQSRFQQPSLSGSNQLGLSLSERSDCRTAVFVDGFEILGQVERTRAIVPGTFGSSALSEIPWTVEHLVGVELYYGRGIPAEFQARVDRADTPRACRVLSVWTRKALIPEGSIRR